MHNFSSKFEWKSNFDMNIINIYLLLGLNVTMLPFTIIFYVYGNGCDVGLWGYKAS